MVEPKYPFVVERFINLGQFCDYEKVKAAKPYIIRLVDEIALNRERAFRCLAGAKSLSDDAMSAILPGVSFEKINKRVKGICSREIKKTSGQAARLAKRFLGTPGPEGYVCLFESVSAQYEKVYDLRDSFGISKYFLAQIQNAALSAGHSVIACQNPYEPTSVEHLLIPGLSLAFVTSGQNAEYNGESYRRLLLDGMIDKELIRKQRSRVRFAQKIARSLSNEAAESFKEANDLKDELEKFYIPCIDLDGVSELAGETAKKLLKKIKLPR